MDPRMMEWLATGERPMPYGVVSFAKSASGSSKKGDDDSDDDEDDEDEDEDDDEDDDDEDEFADMSDDELRAELKKAHASLSKAGGSVKSKRAKIRKLNRELEDERSKKSKPAAKKKADDDDDAPDIEAIREEAKREAAAPAILRAKRSEAKIALRDAGVNPDRVDRAIKQLDLDELDLDDDGLDGIEEAIEELKADLPELFASKRKRRASVAGEGDRNGDNGARKPKMSPSERQAAVATGKR